MRKSIPFSSFGGYRRFSSSWWWDLSHYVIGLDYVLWADERTPLYYRFSWRTPGVWRDLYTYWHRARYGWAPRDTWGLDTYLNGVLAGSLTHLADTTHGAPIGYPHRRARDMNVDPDFAQWEADLRRWATAFSEDPEDVSIYDRPNYVKHTREEKRRRKNIHRALKELEPWWDALWD